MTQARLHPIQVVDIRVTSVFAATRPRSAGSPAKPVTNLPRARVLDVGDDHRSFSLKVSVRATVPVLDDQLWTARIVLTAAFVSEVDVSPAVMRDFARQSGPVIVWPYARTYLSQLAQQAGVAALPLPLVSRTPSG